MKDLSILQKYMVCTVNEKGVFPFVSVEERILGLVAAGLLELEMEGCITIRGRKISAAGRLPAHRTYLEPLYAFIREKQEVKADVVVDAYNFSWTDKRLKALWGAVENRWSRRTRQRPARLGCWANRPATSRPPGVVQSVVEQMRAELLEDGPVCDDTAALVVLLEQVKCLKIYFSDFEQKSIQKKIKAIVDTPEGKIVKDMMTYLQVIMYSSAARGQPQGVRAECPDREAWRSIQQAEYVTIGELVRLTDVRYSTLKFYTEEGMLPFEQAGENLTRRYRREESLARIAHIKALRAGGKSIPEIKALLAEAAT